uniref:AP2/ERF domain-containing protein n=1 Tax=Oryza brachyantha TaxID=4533 RepID=J3M9Y1_ORYBR
MDASLRTLPPASFPGEVRSAVSSLLLSPGGSALDTVFSHLPPPVTIPPLGSSVYYRQSELLRHFAASQGQSTASAACSSTAAEDGAPRKLYRGVRQRQGGEGGGGGARPVRPAPAAHAYDRAAFKLRGEYARLNFPGVMDGGDCPDHLRHLRDAVDAKIQAIRVRMARKRARARRQREESKNQPTDDAKAAAAPARPAISERAASETTTTTTSSYGSPDGVLSMSTASVDGDCPLERMPSFDPELIWEMLNF